MQYEFGHFVQPSSERIVSDDWSERLVWHLHLKPETARLAKLRLPSDYNSTATPLVTYIRSDYLLNFEDANATSANGVSYGPEVYLSRMMDPVSNYGHVLASTGAHWTSHEMGGIRENEILEAFRSVFPEWLHRMQPVTQDSSKRVFVRAASTGHDCGQPDLVPLVDEEPPPAHFNWHWIPYLNMAAQRLLQQETTVTFFDINRLARLRPDAHQFV